MFLTVNVYGVGTYGSGGIGELSIDVDAALKTPPDELYSILRKFKELDDSVPVDGYQGGNTDCLMHLIWHYDRYLPQWLRSIEGRGGENGRHGEIGLDEYVEIIARLRREANDYDRTRRAKKEFMRFRRSQASAALSLKLIASGAVYRCVIDGCDSDDLTVDHVVPVESGGTDDVGNLQFMCRTHNSSKGNQEESKFLARRGLTKQQDEWWVCQKCGFGYSGEFAAEDSWICRDTSYAKARVDAAPCGGQLVRSR